MQVSKVTRICLGCTNPIVGIQVSKDKDWYEFSCLPCDELWGENIKYSLPDQISPIELTENL